MKSNKNAKKDIKRSGFEKNSFDGHKSKAAPKDKSDKKRLSIYDEFDEDEQELLKYKKKKDDFYDEDEDDD